MDNNNQPTSQSEAELLKGLIETQNREIQLKREENSIREQEIKSNERIALASIEAQKETDIKRGEIFSKVYNRGIWLWLAVISAISIIILVAMFLKQINIAQRIIEIAGSVVLGYFAGVNHGKAKAIENQHNKDE